MKKVQLRKKYKHLRSQLSAEEIENLSIEIANQLLKLPIWEKTYYHIFLSIISKKEVDTSFILSVLQGKDKEIVISKSNFEDASMTHYLLTENTRILNNEYQIPEPIDGIEVPLEKIDVVFVPLLAFDEFGYRTGYGKGFYDRFLARCRPETLKIGVSLFEAEKKIGDANKNDIKMDFCVTPAKIYCFNS